MIVKDFSALKKRIGRFLNSKKFERDEVFDLMELSQKLGRVAIFGGMLRDLCIGGNRFFDSDVDLVFEQHDKGNLESLLKEYNYKLNAFGGYRIQLKKWHVDIWKIENTWAFKNNLVKLDGFESLTKTTFFNWDAIVYEVDSGDIHSSDNYLLNLHERYLDINLIDNPNHLSSVVRTLRMLIKLNAKLSPSLRDYVLSNMEKYNSDVIIAYENKKYWKATLSSEIISNIFLNLKYHKANHLRDAFELPSRQYILDL